MKYAIRITIGVLLALSFVIGAASAQETPNVQNVYYMAADSAGVQQIYQLPLDGQSAARQITHAAQDVITFGAAYDGLSVAYISAGQLWLQPIHTDTPEALAPVSAVQFFSGPVFSLDGQYIAYADRGAWLLDLSTRQSRQILADVPVDETGSNADQFRIFMPYRFATDAEGHAAQLLVRIGVWEWQTAGVYDLASGQLQELSGHVHNNLLPLSDGRVLVYGNNGMDGHPGLSIAASLSDVNTYSDILDFTALTDATLFAEQAVETAPGRIRIFGPALDPANPGERVFFFDVDLAAGTASAVRILNLSDGISMNTVAGDLSPDGRIVPVYLGALWTDAGSIYGRFQLHDLDADAVMPVAFPETVGVFRWKP